MKSIRGRDLQLPLLRNPSLPFWLLLSVFWGFQTSILYRALRRIPSKARGLILNWLSEASEPVQDPVIEPGPTWVSDFPNMPSAL
jgi:hypothetical protein